MTASAPTLCRSSTCHSGACAVVTEKTRPFRPGDSRAAVTVPEHANLFTATSLQTERRQEEAYTSSSLFSSPLPPPPFSYYPLSIP
jgi:hypothetical protein